MTKLSEAFKRALRESGMTVADYWRWRREVRDEENEDEAEYERLAMEPCENHYCHCWDCMDRYGRCDAFYRLVCSAFGEYA